MWLFFHAAIVTKGVRRCQWNATAVVYFAVSVGCLMWMSTLWINHHINSTCKRFGKSNATHIRFIFIINLTLSFDTACRIYMRLRFGSWVKYFGPFICIEVEGWSVRNCSNVARFLTSVVSKHVFRMFDYQGNFELIRSDFVFKFRFR